MSHFNCIVCDTAIPLATTANSRVHIGAWCGECNTKYSFTAATDGDGQTKLWCDWHICSCDNRRYGECKCAPAESKVKVKEAKDES